MKKNAIAIAILLIFILPTMALAAGAVCTFSDPVYYGQLKCVISVTCTADDTNHLFPDTAWDSDLIEDLQDGDWYLTSFKTFPGATPPTDATDLSLEDSDGLNVLGASGTDALDATSTLEKFVENSDSVTRPWPILNGVTQKITNNSVDSAIVTIDYIFERGK